MGNSNLNSTEKNAFTAASAIFLIHRSAVTIYNIYFTTEFDAAITTTDFITSQQVDAKVVNITNSVFEVSGRVFWTSNPIKLFMKNILVDYYKSRLGVTLTIACGSLPALEETYVRVENITIYYSQTKLSNLGQRHALVHRGWGDYFVKDSKFLIYSDPGDSSSPIARFDGQPCNLQSNKTFQMIFDNIYITNPYTSTQALSTAETSLRVAGVATTRVNMTITNFTIENAYGSGSLNPIQILIPDNYGLVLKNITLKDIRSNIVVFRVEGGLEKYIENVNIVNCTFLDTQPVLLKGSGKVTLINLIFQQITMSGAFSGDIVELVRYNSVSLLFTL